MASNSARTSCDYYITYNENLPEFPATIKLPLQYSVSIIFVANPVQNFKLFSAI